MTTYLVVGGGVSGLTAADDILLRDPSAQVTVLEAGDRVGGKLRGAEVAGCTVDVGAEAVLARRPEAMELIARAGLADEVVHPTSAGAQIWSRGRLHVLPPRTFMGVPADPDALRGLLTDEEVARARAEKIMTTDADDLSVAELVTDRLGPAVTERLVEPLLGGVYAGHATLLSARAAFPQLLDVARRGDSLVGAVARMMPAPTDGTHARAAAPFFATVRGGLHRLPQALADSLAHRGVSIRTGTTVRELHRLPEGGYEVVTGPRPSPTAYRADRVVLAVPPAPASRLLQDVAPEAARLLAEVETASMAVVTLAFDSRALGDLEGSGFLVPPVEGRAVKASTFSANKWDWVREAGRGRGPEGQDLTILRASLGRHREEATLQVSDEELVRTSLAELAEAVGRALPEPVGTHVQRWGGALPQYAVGHVARIAAVRAALAGVEGLAACGATFDGVGIPACITSAHRAVEELLGTRRTMDA
ncbi:protoporphyrinogen oxidase [Ornithinimicrobium tianjinense]|uniref:Coproporphyrinogen III oxidase n=1 Tax=Ornithinimicrobium tianjinense TaxID=1195761 RepID=A0A917F4P2_9MICO|nr:protoporphyrinogen oxidase [Ornithinimicrobium tianjinense]GGF46314.1 protoporphyrinogen oxidase [Ornithinimicrobium tianjinense]